MEGLGAKLTGALVSHFGGVAEVLSASPEALCRATGIAPALARRIAEARQVQAFQTERRLIVQHGVRLLTLDAPDYPVLLRQTMVPPPVLYVRGDLSPPEGLHLAIVGTRRFTRYGEQTTRRLVGELAQAVPELTVVSGLARGIDTIAHVQALESGLRTLAVLGGGLASIYPPENAELAERIATQGALLSEFHMAQAPLAKNFPIRNRIISGLCAGLLVVEAGERSGALITAGFALNHNREVFAVPGNVDVYTAQGTNRLIQRGHAKLVRDAGDILEELRGFRRSRTVQLDWLAEGTAGAQGTPGGQGEQGRIFDALARGPLHADDLSQELELPVERLLGLLLELELSGVIHQTADNLYALS